MPCNLYGAGDNFDPLTSHAMAALIARLHEAKLAERSEVTLWGTGRPLREFPHVDDLARAVVFSWTGTMGTSTSIAAPAATCLLRRWRRSSPASSITAAIVFDPTKPDGTPRKLMDSSRIAALGRKPQIALEDGIASAYRWYLENKAAGATLAA